MESRQIASLHARAIVDNRQRALARIGLERDQRCAGIEGVGHDLGKNGFFQGAGISIPQIFEEMQ
ncbi:MAG TPA: hypothetical protein VK493_08040 [Bryobacteraceae bacterium]|nr:hypothetical protein [Bryobacteraceae bacterium]